MDHGQDWNPVVIKKPAKKPSSNEEAARLAARGGVGVSNVQKYSGGKNSNNKSDTNMKKLEESEELEHKSLPHEVSLRIQQARQAKQMTQKDLATKINEKSTVINDYEAGRAIPNNTVLAKLERALGVKLRGKLDD